MFLHRLAYKQRDSEENYVFVERGPEGANPRCSSHLGYQSNPRVKPETFNSSNTNW